MIKHLGMRCHDYLQRTFKSTRIKNIEICFHVYTHKELKYGTYTYTERKREDRVCVYIYREGEKKHI